LKSCAKIEATTDLKFRFTEAPAGANHYRETGKVDAGLHRAPLPKKPTAILLGRLRPCRRCVTPTNTEIMPQVEFAFPFSNLYAGRASGRVSFPACRAPSSAPMRAASDLVVIRESTEGLFASMGKGVVHR